MPKSIKRIGSTQKSSPEQTVPVYTRAVARTTGHHPERSLFLPVNRSDMERRNWDYLDFIMISGDAYVDHPSFGATLICRLLEGRGYRVGIIAQPDWRDAENFKILGRPGLAFLVSGGNMDSMVMHYTAAKKPRHDDYYSPGKRAGLRPNRATIVYSAALRQAYKKIPVIIGGVETSLRRLAHFDYWTDSVRRSILLDSKADLAVYGMGERAILEAADRLSDAAASHRPADLTGIRGTLYKVVGDGAVPPRTIELPSFESIQSDRPKYAESFGIQYRNTDPYSARPLAERYPRGETVVQMPPAMPLEQSLFDEVYELPYTRTWHPEYDDAGGIPAIAEVKFSLVSNRGCFGACAFCALTFHQGRNIQARSHESLLREAAEISRLPDFKGYIHDVGGPTANFRIPACAKMAKSGSCPDRVCLGNTPCANLRADHTDYRSLLQKLRAVPGVKKVFIRSGIRYDYLLADADETFFRELVTHHVSGQLKVAPEHVSHHVLEIMGKPDLAVFQEFKKRFERITRNAGKEQYLVPYFISSHPGATLQDAIELALYLKREKIRPQQVQDFYPTPGTLATCMYHTGLDPETMRPVYVAKSAREKNFQRALLQPANPQYSDHAREALKAAGRTDLIGTGPSALVPPSGRGRRR